MNINYHYFTVKTLAYYGGFSASNAQTVAHFANQVDDFILATPILVRQEPPAFFMERGLAAEAGRGEWFFMPCPTGINVAASISHGYQKRALVPFHFIPVAALPELEKEISDRSGYRCVNAQAAAGSMVNKILRGAADAVHNKPDEKNFIALGMALHTYADSYAHSGFSGFHGWENQAKVLKAYDVSLKKEAMSPAEALFYSMTPSIGHANAGHATDVCAYDIEIAMKKDERDGELKLRLMRSNSQQFSVCSRSILNILCEASGKPPFSDREWGTLRSRIISAQLAAGENDRDKTAESWRKAFPDIEYRYDPQEYFSLKLKIENEDEALLNRLGGKINKESVTDPYAEESIRAPFVLSAKVNRYFYDYNELAYRRVYDVTGETCSPNVAEQLRHLTEKE